MRALACVLAAAAVCAAAAPAAGASVRQTFRAGLASVQQGDYHARALAARKTLARLRREREPTRARSLAIGGFLWALWGLRAQIEFVDQDSGEVAEATRDSARADRCWIQAARRLRAAGRELGVPVGLVNGR